MPAPCRSSTRCSIGERCHDGHSRGLTSGRVRWSRTPRQVKAGAGWSATAHC